MVSNGWTGPLDDDGNVVSILSGNYADDAFIAKLATLPKLRVLCLYIPVNLPDHGEITAAGFAQLAEYPALENLNLMFVANLPNKAGDMALRAAGRIKTLRVLRTSLSEATDEGIAGLAGMTQLTSLSLNYSHITDASLGVLAGLTNLANLELIASRVRGTKAEITDVGIKQMARLTGVRDAPA